MRAPAEEALVEVVELKPGLYVDRTLLPAENRNLRVCVVNTTTEAQTIAAGTCLGNASSVSAVINGSENSGLATASDNKFLADTGDLRRSESQRSLHKLASHSMKAAL